MGSPTTTGFSERHTIGDLVRYYLRQGYNFVNAKVYNRTASAITLADPMGYPLKNDYAVTGAFQFAVAGDEANVTGLYCDVNVNGQGTPITALAANTALGKNVAVLARGPAIIDQNILPAKDVAASNFTIATIVTALAALKAPILANPEETNTFTQTN